MIAKLERTLRNVYRNKAHKQWEVHKTLHQQQQNHSIRTDTALATGKFKCILLAPNIRSKLCCNCLTRMEAS